MDKIWNFFDWLLYVSCMSWEVKNDMSGQSKDAVRMCNVKIRKSLSGVKRGTSLCLFQLMAPSVEWFKLFFFRNSKIRRKWIPRPKLSDFEWLGEVFKIIMFNMFVWFYHISLTSYLNTCLILMYDHAKTCQKLPTLAHFCDIKVLYGPLVATFFHILVEKVLSFNLHGQISKFDNY